MCNFSLFQSLPDHWAFDQLFPIVPIHRMTRSPPASARSSTSPATPTARSTASSKSRTSKRHSAASHPQAGEPYYLGLFLTGAYQDIMGDMHNLFGRVNEVHVFVGRRDPDGYYIEEVIPGDTIEQVLSRMQYAPDDLARRVRAPSTRR